jgi:hypothetical protein
LEQERCRSTPRRRPGLARLENRGICHGSSGSSPRRIARRDQVIDALEHALAARSPQMTSLKVVPWLDPTRDDPRLTRILHAMHFP